ncbi:hypothetical protein ATANTOWER_023768 [Ataeniobius toweri]|uniref:Uncharacterized protein n=1 Tax=Ataeniobius toweri TaxID=208326 RepID=A0ABU7BUW4_9TELE|nr:hypothetical protein [Ataeniobius toweri]
MQIMYSASSPSPPFMSSCDPDVDGWRGNGDDGKKMEEVRVSWKRCHHRCMFSQAVLILTLGPIIYFIHLFMFNFFFLALNPENIQTGMFYGHTCILYGIFFVHTAFLSFL